MRDFREVLKLDIDSIETDVHMTKDYHIVMCHDRKLDRTTDKKGEICRLTFDEVRQAVAGICLGEKIKCYSGNTNLIMLFDRR